MRSRVITIVALVSALTLAAISPAMASAHVPDPIDTGASATCKFTVVDHVYDEDLYPYGILAVGILNKIVVRPPTMYGLTPHASPVSWRFAVHKSWNWYGGGTWKVVYKSPQQYSSASSEIAADFHKMAFRPPTPKNDNELPSNTSYRVEIRMTWWNPDSPVIYSQLSYMLTELRQVVDGVPTDAIQMCYWREHFVGF
jgi:hypothetical protein